MVDTGYLHAAQGRGGGDYTLRRSQVKRNAAWSCASLPCYTRDVSRTFLIGCVWWISAWAWPAHAYEDQASLDAELGYGHAVSDAVPPHGVALGVGASLGLNDLFTARGQFTWALHPSERRVLSALLLSAEILYLVDVLEIVPYFGAGIDGIATLGDSLGTDLGVHPVLGFDWLVSRELTLGMQVRSIFLLTAWSRDPVYFKAGVTASYLIDLF